MKNKNCTSIGTLVGELLDQYLYDNHREVTAKSFAEHLGVSAKTVQRWRYEGIPTTFDADIVLQAIGASIRVIFDQEDDSVFL